jgi:hypothetical protein
MQILLLIPWVLTVFILLFLRKKRVQDNLMTEEEDFLKVAIVEGMAYWVHDNVFYFTEIDEYGDPIFEEKQKINTMSLNAQEVNRLLDILDYLKEEGQ